MSSVLTSTPTPIARSQARAKSRIGLWLVAATPRLRPYSIVLALTAVVVSRWFHAGTFIATGDMGPFIRRGWAPEAMWSWNHSVTGAGSAAYNVGRGLEFIIIDTVHALGGTNYIAQWIFYTMIYSLVGFGCAYLAAAFVDNEVAIVAAGAFGILNGFFLTRLPNPLNIISVGSLALITGVAMRVAQGKRVPTPVAGIALMPTSFLAFNPPMLVVAYAWAGGGTLLLAALIYGRKGFGRLAWWLIRGAGWALVLNAWWLIPLAQGYTGGGGATANAAFTDPTSWSWAQINNTIPNVMTLVANWAWYRPQYLPFAATLDEPIIVWIRYLLPTLVVLAPLVALRQRKRAAYSLLLLVIVIVFLAKGLVPPLTSVNLFLYNHVPGFWLFREPMSKLGQLLVPFYAVLIAMLLEGLFTQLRERGTVLWRIATVAGVGTVILVLAYPFPLWTGAVIPDARPQQPSAHVRIPSYWPALAAHIDSDPRPGRVLVLPLDDYYQMPTTWGFFGTDTIAGLLLQHPVVQRHPDGYFGDKPGYAAQVNGIETALTTGDLAAVTPLLRSLGITYVIVRHDLLRGIPGRTFADDRILHAAIRRVPGLSIDKGVTGPLELWRVDKPANAGVQAFTKTLGTTSDAASQGAVVATLTPGVAITSPTKAKAVLVRSPLQATNDTMTWDVPAVDSGAPRTTISTHGGTYTLAQRARANTPMIPAFDPATSTVNFTDPTQVRVDGVVVSTRPVLHVKVPTTPLAVTVGTRSLSLDKYGRTGLPGSGGKTTAATAPVGSATPLTVWGASTVPAQVTHYSTVYDCDNYQPRPASELGLKRDLLPTKAGVVVRLSALDHAACSRVVVTNAQPGRTYRIRMQYRQISGARPQICIWQTGADGCVVTARPQLGTTWKSYEAFVTVDAAATGLQIILHGDVGLRHAMHTVTDYRNLQVEALSPIAQTTIFPPQVRATHVHLSAGSHTLSVTGGLSGSLLAPFEPLQDCFRYDDKTMSQAGLTAVTTTTKKGSKTISLSARDHMACLGATIPDMGGAGMYQLSMQAKSIKVRNPRFCLYLRGPDHCATLPAGGPWKGWTTYTAVVQPDPSAVETRFYLYGPRDVTGQTVATVGYRFIRFRPYATSSTIVLVRDDAAAKSPAVTYKRQTPAHFTAVAPSSPASVVALTETYAPGWSLRGTAVGKGADKPKHVLVQGWMNGWELSPSTVPAASSVRFVYNPAYTARKALLLLPIAVMAAAFWLAAVPLGRRFWRWRRSRHV